MALQLCVELCDQGLQHADGVPLGDRDAAISSENMRSGNDHEPFARSTGRKCSSCCHEENAVNEKPVAFGDGDLLHNGFRSFSR